MSSDSFEEDDVQRMLEDIALENGFENPTFEIEIATKAGDNFMGRVLRAKILQDGKDTMSLIFKTAPLSKFRRNAINSGTMFLNEGNMYNIVMPALNSYLRKNGLSDSATFPCTPRCISSRISSYLSENDTLDVLVLEDMGSKGYKMVDRVAGLDAEKCKMIVKALARLHAASLALRKQQPEQAAALEKNIREVAFFKDNPLLISMLPVMQNCLSMVEDRYPEGSSEHTKLKNFVDNFVEEFIELARPNDTLSCITHGDCWCNNILFKFGENDAVEQICLVDFQISRVASPVLDLVYLMFTCVSKETRDAHYQEILQTYHKEATSVVEALGCDPEAIFSWSTFEDELKKYGRYGLGMAFVTTPAFLVDPADMPDLDGAMESGNANLGDVLSSININKVHLCKKRLADVLEDMIHLGYF